MADPRAAPAAVPRRGATLLFLVTEDWYFVSHRLELAREAVAQGFRVVVATRVRAHGDAIRQAGCDLRPLAWRRSGNGPWAHWRAYRELLGLYRTVRPDLVHHVALKPVIFGSWAARRTGLPARVNALAGLGFVFSSGSLRARMLRPLLLGLLRQALSGPRQIVIVQNQADRAALLAGRLVEPQQVRLIRGAGVDPARHPPGQRLTPPLVVLVARMLWGKGVAEFVAAAVALKMRGVAARFALVGAPDDDSPDAVPRGQLEQWQRDGAVEWWGQRDDVPAILAQASVFCLPTRYGEGIPRSLLEAAAAGLALVAADGPGCREVIDHEQTGLLVPPADEPALVAALGRLLDDAPLRESLGQAARRKVIAQFSLSRITAETLAVYRELVG